MFTSTVAGFSVGLALIVAVGAQNAFVLRQGLRREHVLPVVLTCALSDTLLIGAGVGGLGAVVADRPVLLAVVRWGGAAFLLGYAGLAARRAVRPGRLTPAEQPPATLRATLLACLAGAGRPDRAGDGRGRGGAGGGVTARPDGRRAAPRGRVLRDQRRRGRR
ncbi:LysE family transporter [Micromonospora sp. WMMD882]|uniref:LysE/ArgO family amino acid transporter n=1 Tax=Micromonospora sp. WMMD882 TaxID=3015151 RepID=UPI00248C293C|nr:LysE family transporter [Micromonospora sp. WMMD882]WBB82402.1 LysE family transporter [Micromonospora sp. WMMD882]